MTQQQYLQWMASVCGDRLPASASAQDYVNWARGKGMNPAGGWQLNAKLTKEVVAQTLVQLLNLAPRKGNFDAVRILEREGILLASDNGFVGVKQLVGLIDDGFAARAHGNGHAYGHSDDDDNLTPTKPGWGYGDKNHVHTGPPPISGIHPGKGHGGH